MFEKLIRELSEIRLDIHEADQGKLRLGFTLTVATLVVAASGWPTGDMVDHALFYALGALPLAGIGLGLIIGELMQGRADRQGHRRADDREVRALRARIAAEARGRGRQATTDMPTLPDPIRPTPKRRRPAEPIRSTDSGRRQRLVARRRARNPFRSGYLHLR